MDIDQLRERIDTIVIVLMENRSFDHMLGHLRLPQFGNRTDLDGLVAIDEPSYANLYRSEPFYPFPMPDAPLQASDLPHGRAEIQVQLAASAAAGRHTMRGFVEAYYQMDEMKNIGPEATPPPMGFFTPKEVPITSFFARQFAVCDKWFACLPADTQPNRLMALSGYTLLDHTQNGLLAEQDLVFKWLSERKVRWRVYSAGLSFLLLFPHMWPQLITSENFRRLPELSRDFQNEPDDVFPEVIFVEPDYLDTPVHLSGHPNDNHPPLPIAFGEDFLRTVYQAVTSSSARWARTLIVVTYDEHGGFFDHVPPARIRNEAPAGAVYAPFDTTGVRVPALLVSPLVNPGSVHHGLLDHTSILQLLADRFAAEPAEGYSPNVESRRRQGVGSVTAALDRRDPRADIPAVPDEPIAASALLGAVKKAQRANEIAFETAIQKILDKHGPDASKAYPELAHWKGAT